MAYFKELSSSLPAEIGGNATINFFQGCHPAEIRTGYFSNTGTGNLVLAMH